MRRIRGIALVPFALVAGFFAGLPAMAGAAGRDAAALEREAAVIPGAVEGVLAAKDDKGRGDKGRGHRWDGEGKRHRGHGDRDRWRDDRHGRREDRREWREDRRDRAHDRRDWERDRREWRAERRDDWRDDRREAYREGYRDGKHHRHYRERDWVHYHKPPRHYRNRWGYRPGYYVPAPRYVVIHDYPRYGYRPPPVGYGYARIDGDVFLVALATGLLVAAINN